MGRKVARRRNRRRKSPRIRTEQGEHHKKKHSQKEKYREARKHSHKEEDREARNVKDSELDNQGLS